MQTDIPKKVIAAFDFDGTITTKDTLFDFISFYFGKMRMVSGLLFLSPMLFLFKLGFMTNDNAKEKMFTYFFKGKKADDFNKACDKYTERISQICNQRSLDQINWHLQQGHEILIVSASVENWIKPWALTYGFTTVLGTQIEVKNGILSGKFSSNNCYGKEKVNRLKAAYPNREEYILYAYGDSSGDTELLEYADYPTLYK